ncbi:hypothetical protein, partial [Nonomuraea sp. NPDC049141]|uniref:hypothetical protein n=1 Tax=Nonomuraea sp. NPDC049141 TaxID=3155500 RepID=UPI0033E6CA1F
FIVRAASLQIIRLHRTLLHVQDTRIRQKRAAGRGNCWSETYVRSTVPYRAKVLDMVDHPGFGALLTRLLDYRKADIAWLASASGIPEAELSSVAGGVPPSVAQLEGLAAGLGFHTADLLVIAGVPVPESLEPCEPATGHELEALIRIAMALPSDQQARIRETVEHLPQLPPIRPADPPRTYYRRDGSAGSMHVTMLCANRNLCSPVAAAKTLARVTGGRVYVAASTLHSISASRTVLKPAWLAGFATVLGIPATDLAAITGIDLPEPPPLDDPPAADMAELLWVCRRLTTSQIEHLHLEAKAMLVEVPANASDDDWNRIYKRTETWWGAPRQ